MIVPSPDAVMQLDGSSTRQAYAELGQESLWKGLDRVIKTRSQAVPAGVARAFSRFVKDVPPTPLFNLLMRAFGGDKEAQAEVDTLPSWAFFLESLRSRQREVSPVKVIEAQHFMEVEHVSRPVDVLLTQHSYTDAALAWRKVPELRHYLREVTLTSWSRASNLVEMLPGRAAGMCELLLSLVARADCELADYGLNPGNFTSLLPPVGEGKCLPGREFMRWAMNALRLQSQGEFLELAHKVHPPNKQLVHESTLKAWCAGSDFPSLSKLSPILLAVATQRLSDAELSVVSEAAAVRYWAARRFVKLLELVEFFACQGRLQGHPAGFMDLLGTSTARDWLVVRFHFWHGYWSERQASVLPCDWAPAA